MTELDYSKIGRIWCQTRHNGLGKLESIEYTWEGGPMALVSRVTQPFNDAIDWDAPYIIIGPYRLRLVEDRAWRGDNLYIREDYPLWWALVLWHKLTWWTEIIKSRIILTFVVWGMADYDQAAIPSWIDIRVLRRVQELLKQ